MEKGQLLFISIFRITIDMKEQNCLEDCRTINKNYVLNRGHIFLNTCKTESFCFVDLEAACCGLLVVFTDVNGVQEVLTPHIAYQTKPEEKSILKQLRITFKKKKYGH